jgi:hypothetical protein
MQAVWLCHRGPSFHTAALYSRAFSELVHTDRSLRCAAAHMLQCSPRSRRAHNVGDKTSACQHPYGLINALQDQPQVPGHGEIFEQLEPSAKAGFVRGSGGGAELRARVHLT